MYMLTNLHNLPGSLLAVPSSFTVWDIKAIHTIAGSTFEYTNRVTSKNPDFKSEGFGSSLVHALLGRQEDRWTIQVLGHVGHVGGYYQMPFIYIYMYMCVGLCIHTHSVYDVYMCTSYVYILVFVHISICTYT